jgi:hypothetical protein
LRQQENAERERQERARMVRRPDSNDRFYNILTSHFFKYHFIIDLFDPIQREERAKQEADQRRLVAQQRIQARKKKKKKKKISKKKKYFIYFFVFQFRNKRD